MTASRARMLHLVVALVATAALVLQTVLVLQGGRVLDETSVPPLGIRLGRLVSYFTIQSNVLVAVTAWQLWRDPARDGRWWRPVRLAALVGITVTGLVHFVLLRPLLDLEGADWLADKLLHMAVPVLAVLAWFLVGPRPRTTWRTAGEALAWPVVWLVWTLVVGALSGWYPYPFLDHREDGGAAGVVVACVGITVLFLGLFAGVVALDRRLRPAPAEPVSPATPAR
ncbi:Pr6Pr family membrane protein [Phycicoccus avicenniae]|uniref:Pr6Pr family membrane protein n=1 Tax=Phycicoccus avicenniae TaxID=2828860 RepID=UPI003D2B5A46